MTCKNNQCENGAGFHRQTVQARTAEEIRYGQLWAEIKLPKLLTTDQHKNLLFLKKKKQKDKQQQVLKSTTEIPSASHREAGFNPQHIPSASQCEAGYKNNDANNNANENTINKALSSQIHPRKKASTKDKPKKNPHKTGKTYTTYQPKRIFLETLIGYQEASLTRTLNNYTGGEPQ